MEILITNDDGFNSKGLLILVRQMQKLGHVTVVAPDGARSGQSSAISVMKPMRLKKIECAENKNVDFYVSNGTPADCVKLALNVLYKDHYPDLVVSGVNHGSNASVNVVYSGTMGAIFVAAEHNVPAIGFSLCAHEASADFSEIERYICPLTEKLLSRPFPYGFCYNINAPKGHVAGVRVTRQCNGYWEKEIKEYVDPNGEPFYWLVGEFVNCEPDNEDTDEWALSHGYISITPTSINMTDNRWNDLIDIGLVSL